SALFIINFEAIQIISLFIMYGWAIILLFLWRALYLYLCKTIIHKKFHFKNVVIVGFGELAREMRKFFRLHPEYGFRFMGYFDHTSTNADIKSLSSLEAFCKSNSVHEIYCCLPYLQNDKVKS